MRPRITGRPQTGLGRARRRGGWSTSFLVWFEMGPGFLCWGVARVAVSELQWVMVVDREESLLTEFSEFFAQAEPRLRRALVAAHGPDRGRDAAAAALGYAWVNWSRVADMEFPIAYLFRVGQSETRSRRRRVLHEPIAGVEPWVEPHLGAALRSLSARQRTAVVLVHAFDWSIGDVAALTGTASTTVQSHLQRGLARLRIELEVESE